MHAADGLQAPRCNAGPRARYEVRGLAAASFVRLMLSRLGFARGDVARIMSESMRQYALRVCAPRGVRPVVPAEPELTP